MATVLTTTYDSTTDTTGLTITLASLPTSSGLLVGRESTAISNASFQYIDFNAFGQIMTGTTPTVNTYIEVWCYGSIKVASSTPTYPSPLTGSDAGATFVAETKARLALVDSMLVNATSNTAYAFRPFSVAQLLGGVPLRWGVFVTHSTAANLNSTAGNHWIHYSGIKYTNT